MIITNSRYALVGYFTTSYPTQAHGIIVIYPTKAKFNNCFIIYSKYFQTLKGENDLFVFLLIKNNTTLCTGQFQNRPCPPRANPWAFDFFEKFWSNSPLCCQFRRSYAPPVRASKRVKSPTLQVCEANCGNKFCKIFSHYEFLVQLVFTPDFKQRHIPP